MKYYLFLIGFTILVISSCQKNKDAELPATVNCTNITQTINDTLVSLTTVQTGTAVYIAKTQNSITSIVANQTGFEFWGPSISPDKTKFICFRSPTGNTEKFNDYTSAELWLFNIDGSNGHSIATLSSQTLHAMGMGKWAPDGFHIVFSGEKNETDGNLHWNIYLTDTTGTLATKMNTRLGSFKYPAFANGDMTKLAYEAWNVGIINAGSVFDTEIHYATVNGSFQFITEQKITANEDLEYSPSFSPDNTTIVYCQNTSLAANTAIELYSSNLSTLTATKILSNNNINEYPVWCNTNNKIYYLDNSNGSCFERVNRINPDGTGNATVYQQTNAQIRHIDIK